MVVAHRGHSSVAPENTIAAIERAVAAGVRAVEFDVRRTADGAIVLMHDKTVERTTDGSGAVADLNLGELERLDAGSWKSPEFAGERVPTLRAALEHLRESKAYAVVEIKDRLIGTAVAREIAESGMGASATVISFDDRDLSETRAAMADLPTGLLTSDVTSADLLAARARACGARIVDVAFRALSGEVVGSLRAAGMDVWAWTVNEPESIRTLAAWGVTAVTTDDPGRGIAALGVPQTPE
jgi:glycerophosphoryl diester phosphodiesterase